MLRNEFLEQERVLLRKTYEGIPAHTAGVVVAVHFATNKLLVKWDQVEGSEVYGEALFTEALADLLIKAEPVKIDPLRHTSRVQLSRDYAGLPAKTCGTIIKRRLHLDDITYTVESDLQDAAGNYRTFEIPERDVDYLASRNVSPRSV